jgi:hypothetical protein
LSGEKADLVEHDFDVFALLFELGPAAFEPDREFLQLAAFAAGKVVQFE